MSTRTLTIPSFDGCTLFCTIDGDDDAPPVVFSHSLGFSLEMWSSQVQVLVDRFKVVRYDSRGHGRSAVPEGEYSIEMLGRDALAVLDAVGIRRAHFVGLSMGAMTGMWLAANHRDRIAKLVLANTTAHIGRPQMWQERIAQAREKGLDEIAAATISRWLSPSFKAERPDEVNRLVETMRAMPLQGYLGSCAVLRDVDLRKDLKKIIAPTLVIAGAEYGGNEADAAERLRAGIAGALLVTIRRAAHLSNLENPAEFNEVLRRFLIDSHFEVAKNG
ncbi:MAG: 3-oxoadipate enol-lactonase [Pseudomonadota bacterium]|jgi:3-oxoadipate enol-lactonase|nr:MAG: 3-oxoadipate enol-lactonase [Pseudomonadota bacterium]